MQAPSRWSDCGPDRPALVRRHRQRKRGPDGDRRHQRQGRPAGRQLELCFEDSATDDAVAAEEAEKLVARRGRRSSAASTAPPARRSSGPAVTEGKTLYIYPEQYEGQESDPLIFCTGPGPALYFVTRLRIALNSAAIALALLGAPATAKTASQPMPTVAAAVAAPGRSANNLKLDEIRKPARSPALPGLRPGMKVLDPFGAQQILGRDHRTGGRSEGTCDGLGADTVP